MRNKEPKEPMAKVTIRLPDGLWKWIGHYAIERGCNRQAVIGEALERFRKRHSAQQPPAASRGTR